MPNNDSHQHVVRTSAQWDACAEEYWVVPRGCLCVELTPKGKTKIKVGEGNKYYAQLPYITGETDLSQYYTKEEIDNLFNNLNRMAIMSTEEYDSRSDLPLEGNKLGDVRFVKTASPSIKLDPDVYLWNGKKWIFVGYDFVEADLSKYLKKEEFHELFDPVKEQVDEMYPKMHTHDNKQILDQVTAPYTVPEKEKLAGLENYDDTEIREMIHESSHTHPNKPILDTITEDSLWSQADRDKFDGLHNYDDGPITERVEELEDKSHTHVNKTFLDTIMYPYQIWSQEDRDKFDSLSNPEVFVGTDGLYPGRKGLVPAPAITDIGKFLSSSGQWISIESASDFIGATDVDSGVHGLVPAPLAGEQSYYLKGDGTWSEINIQEYKPGTGVSFVRNQDRYDEVEYIRYSGTERLYTGAHVITGKLKAYIKWMWISNSHGLCLFANTNDRNYVNDDTLMAAFSSRYYDVKYGNSNANQNVSSTRELRVIYEDELETVHRIYHRMNTSRLDSVNAFCVDREIWLFGSYNSGGTGYYGDRRIYAFKVWDDDVLILDMIPVRSSDNILGMYDRVSNTFKTIEHPENIDAGPDTGKIIGDFSEYVTNDGVLDITQENPLALNEITVHFNNTSKTLTIPSSGDSRTYTAGPGIEVAQGTYETYRVVEYFQSDGSQTVNTGYCKTVTNGSMNVEIKWRLVSTPTARAFVLSTHDVGASITTGSVFIGAIKDTSMSEYRPAAGIITSSDGSGSSFQYDASGIATSTRYDLAGFDNDGNISLNIGTFYSIDTGATWRNVFLYDSTPAVIYFCKIFDDDVLVCDLVPCIRDEDNAQGFYDRVREIFIENTGTAFTMGQETGEVISRFVHESELDPYEITNTGIIEASYSKQALELTLRNRNETIVVPVSDTQYIAGDNIVVTGQQESFTLLQYIKGKGNQTINTHKRITSQEGKFEYKFQMKNSLSTSQSGRNEAIICGEYMQVATPFIGIAKSRDNTVGSVAGIVKADDSLSWYWINQGDTTALVEGSMEYHSDGTVTKDGSTYAPDSWPIINDSEIYIFGNHDFKSCCDLYYVKIYDNNVLIFDGIPIRRNSDGEIGLFDRVDNTFYMNDLGGGSFGFVAGPDVSGADPILGDYIGTTKTISATVGVTSVTQDSQNQNTLHVTANGVTTDITIPTEDNVYYPGQGIEFTHPESELYRVVEYIKKPKGVTVTTDVIPSGTTDFRCDMKYFSYIGRFTILAHNGERGSFCFSPPATKTSSATRMWMYSAHETWEDLYLSSSSYSVDPVVAHLRWGYTMSIAYDHIADTSQKTTDILPGTNNVGFSSECDTSYYWAKFYENDILVGDLVPVIRDSDNAYGFFNKITNVFSAADGAMSGGAETGEVITIGDISEKHITAKLGIGLTFNANDAIELDDTIKIKLNCNNEPD